MMLQSDGSWKAPEGSPHRSLTAVEVADLKLMAESVTPVFIGEHNATFEKHHPLVQEIFERKGLKPK